MHTPKRFSGSGPNMLTNGPDMSGASSEDICESSIIAGMKPPLFESTATITATMPTSMTMPCRKSFITVAMYPPRTTYMQVTTAMPMTHHS